MYELEKADQFKGVVVPIIEKANAIMLQGSGDYREAAEFLKRVKETQKNIKDFFGPLKKKAHEAWKTICDREKSLVDPLNKAEQVTKTKMLNYQRAEEEKRLAEERKLQAEAEAKAQREREKLIKQAEKLKTPELREQRLAEAEEIEAPVVKIEKEAPKVEGISTRKIWKAEVVNKVALIKASLENPMLIPFITVDQSALNKYAASTKGEIEIPGVLFYEEGVLSAGGK